MGLLICDLCDAHLPLSIDNNHECNQEDILVKIKNLESRANKAERRLYDINDAGLKVFANIPQKDLDCEWLRELWDSLQLQFDYTAQDIKTFNAQWMATHRVLCEAFDLFRSFHNGRENHYLSLLDKLKVLYRACLEAAEICSYRTDSLDMTPEQLVAEGS